MSHTLYLIRHASAGERSPSYPDDSQRPLDDKGFKQAKTLARVLKTLDVTFDRLFSSPYTRAAQTAERLVGRLAEGRRVQYLDTLAGDDYQQLLVDVVENVTPADKTVALVGHEPYLSELASYLLTGTTSVPLRVRKAAWATLAGGLAPGEMTLQTLLPAAVYRRVRV